MDIRKTLLCSLFVIGTAAHAEGLYILGSVGKTDTDLKDISKSDLDAVGEEAAALFGLDYSSKLDSKDTGYKLQLGYQFSPNFAVEGGYVNLGETEYKYTISDGFDSATGDLSFETKGWNVAGVAILPLQSGVSLFGKLGLIRAETEFSGTGFDSEEATATSATFGIGVAWNFIDKLSVRGEWERFAKVGDEDDIGTELDIDLLSIGLSYQF